ncbi:NAD(P)-dependent dehydrogenase (short-subunit alcohol dehydrogenase family) [Novosphingobium hassiacum]|uniref:NAD(P)-dependent dehydrogenase (Short-subunit alcohol dehydrogenase family) n=1 Tax=Novosphingobium hassiacum TaxID=173676 RepID=A0A7W6A088_9SPHN|nr:SDR family oxidoreductase [Novosphingobium hassiacum]MBB3862363.1 NAD(P)-dependent dehydrogenase (short-subunit alcohol dehydrogenase family) [Novosphingobium hassiacum]
MNSCAVSAAYFARGGRFDPLADSDWADNFRVTLDGVFQDMRACTPRMSAGGAVVNIASVAAMVEMPVKAGYGAAKSAVIGLTRTVAVTLAPRGIRANSLPPGFATTKAPDDIAGTVAFLASDDAAFITGAWWSMAGSPRNDVRHPAFLGGHDGETS